jgi:hypothetical protein
MLIGYLKNEDVYDMCNCAFEPITTTRGDTFVAESEWKNAWMNIDGESIQPA